MKFVNDSYLPSLPTFIQLNLLNTHLTNVSCKFITFFSASAHFSDFLILKMLDFLPVKSKHVHVNLKDNEKSSSRVRSTMLLALFLNDHTVAQDSFYRH